MQKVNNIEVKEDTEITDEKIELTHIDEIMPYLEIEASKKGLKAFVFNNEQVNKFFKTDNSELSIVTLAKSEESAIWNLANLKHCYSVKI